MYSCWKSILSEYIYRLHQATSNIRDWSYPKTEWFHVPEPISMAGQRRQNCESSCQVTGHARVFGEGGGGGSALMERSLKKKKWTISPNLCCYIESKKDSDLKSMEQNKDKEIFHNPFLIEKHNEVKATHNFTWKIYK